MTNIELDLTRENADLAAERDQLRLKLAEARRRCDHLDALVDQLLVAVGSEARHFFLPS